MKEKQINLENKTKFFAQYWGQKILLFDGLPSDVDSWIDGSNSKSFVLNLKPLSSITDEDAIALSKIILEAPFSRYRNINVTRNFSVTDFPYIMVSHKNLRHRLQIDCTLVNFNILELEEDVSSQIDMKPYACIDYLRSKGYALPWMGLSVDEMVEAGWINLQP